MFLNISFAVVSGVTRSESSCMKCPRYEPMPRAKGSLKAKELKYDSTLKYGCEKYLSQITFCHLLGLHTVGEVLEAICSNRATYSGLPRTIPDGFRASPGMESL